MSVADVKQSSSSSNTYLLVPIFLFFALLIIAVLGGPSLISNAGIGSAIIVAAPLILATYALTVIVMAGRVGIDLSIGPLIGFLNVGMIQLYAADVITTPFDFFAYAIAVGVAYQLLMGLIIVFVRVQPIIVALSGFLALVGLNLVILPRPGGVAPEWMMPWGLGTSILSPVLAILVLATIAWYFLTRTAFFGHLRLMGSDERTAYTSGVRINIVRLGAHVVAGVYAALAAITFTALISSGDPTQGSTYTLMAVTALVLGGTSLAGGRGSIIGSLLGALNIYLISFVLSTFSFGMVQSFVTEVAYGVVLVISLLLTLILPRLPDRIRGISPFAFFVILGVIALGVILHAKDKIVAPVSAPVSSGLTVLEADTGSSSGSGLTVLGADSGLTVLGGEISAVSQSTTGGTALVITAVIIAVVLYLLYLLYRHVSASLVAFIGVLILLVLGVTLYDRIDPAISVKDSAAGASVRTAYAQPPYIFHYEVVESRAQTSGTSIYGPGASVFASPLTNWVLVFVGAILVGTLLIVVAVHRVDTRIRNTPLAFYLALAAAVTAVIVFASDGYGKFSNLFFVEAFAAIVVGALLFIVTLPPVQSRVRNFPLMFFALLSATALGAMYFAGGPDIATAIPAAPAPSAAESLSGVASAPATPVDVQNVILPDAFYFEVFWIVLVTAALFLVSLPRVWARVLRYISFDKGVKALSYTGVFIVIFSIVTLAALFYAAEVPLWKLGVAVVSAIIGARFVWHFLRHYRRIGAPGFGFTGNGEPQTVREMLGVDR